MNEQNQAETEIEPEVLPTDGLEPRLPKLSKDGWELVQYRLWDSIRSKMWRTLSVFLTLVTLGGLLGIPAYISGRIGTEIAAEKKKFEELRSQLQEENATLQSRVSLTSHLLSRWALDRAELQRILIQVESDLDDSRLSQGEQQEIRSSLRILLRRFPRRHFEEEDLCFEVRMVVDLLDTGALPDSPKAYSSSPLTREEWGKFVALSNRHKLRGLPQLYALTSHLSGLDLALRKNYRLMMEPQLSDPAQRAELHSQYNSTVFPVYRRFLDGVYSEERPPPWASSWSWLAESGVAAFFQEERELARLDQDVASE